MFNKRVNLTELFKKLLKKIDLETQKELDISVIQKK